MFSLNRIQLVGYQTQPVAVRQTPGGTSVTDLNIVVPYAFKNDAGNMIDGKAFFAVTLWGGMAETAGKFVRPGAQIYVSGRLQTDTWEDEKTGEKRARTKVIANDMILLEPKDGAISVPENAGAVTQCLNRCDVLGNVTRDPEIRTTPAGQKVLTIGVASNERWKDRNTNEDRERTEFHNVVIWGDLAETVGRTVRKGSKVYCSGRVQNRSWETKEGQKRVSTEIVADTALLLGVKSRGLENVIQMTGEAPAPRMQREKAAVATPSVDDLEATALSYQPSVKVEDLPF
jgi:single-strand DNA-binding protein